MLLRVLKIILLLIIVLVLSRNLLIKSSIENIFKSLKIEGFSLGKVNLLLKDFKLSLDLENINLKNNTIGNLKLVVNSIDYPLFTNSSYIRIKCESIDIQSLKANLTSLKQLFNIDSNKESKKDSRTSFALELIVDEINVKDFLANEYILVIDEMSFESIKKSLKLNKIQLLNKDTFFEIENLILDENIASANINSKDFNFTELLSVIGFDGKTGALSINSMNLNYDLIEQVLNGNFDFYVQQPSIRTLNFFRTILSKAFNESFNINNRKNAYLKAIGLIRENVINIKELSAKSNLASFSGNGTIGLFDQKLNLLIKLKGIEHFIPLETLKLNYIIPGDLIPISVKGTISEPKVNIALSKVVTTVEPKLLQKIQNSLIKILFNKPSP